MNATHWFTRTQSLLAICFAFIVAQTNLLNVSAHQQDMPFMAVLAYPFLFVTHTVMTGTFFATHAAIVPLIGAFVG